MKTSTKVVLITASLFIILGLIGFFTALVLGGKMNNKDFYKTYNYTDTYSNVTSISMNIAVGKVRILKGQEFKIEATGIIKDRFSSTFNNGTLTIEEKGRNISNIFDFIWSFCNGLNFIHYSPVITVYVPENTVLDNFDLMLSAGDVTIDELVTKDITVDVSTGKLTINNLNSQSSDINCSVGNITINGIMTGNNKVDCSVGSINLNLEGNEKDYNYIYDVGVGSIKVNGIEHSKGSAHNTIDNKAPNNFDINCGVGSIEIEIGE